MGLLSNSGKAYREGTPSWKRHEHHRPERAADELKSKIVTLYELPLDLDDEIVMENLSLLTIQGQECLVR